MEHRLGCAVARAGRADVVGAAVLLCIVAGVAYRITVGVDLGDEAYYLSFIDDWFKEGFRASPLVTIHQTAALLVYPTAWAYREVTGSVDGLMLFLRALYVIGSCTAALFTMLFLRRVGTRSAAWLGAALVMAFIPFGLPAPSYNTLGAQAMMIGMAAFGCALIEGEHVRAQAGHWLTVSAVAWTIAVIAYPTLLVVLVIQCAGAWAVAPALRRRTLTFAGAAALMQTGAWLAVYAVLTPSHVHDIMAFHLVAVDEAGFARKLEAARTIFASHPSFAAIAVAALACGVLRTL